MTEYDDEARLYLLKLFTERFSCCLKPYGFEIAPFLAGWYNDLVATPVMLDQRIAPHADCVAICIISSPSMFENSFRPHLSAWFQPSEVRSLDSALRRVKAETIGIARPPGLNDPLDWSVLLRVSGALKTTLLELGPRLPPEGLALLASHKFIPDYETRPVSRLPAVHMQCAGHVAGLAYFHQDSSKSMDGCPGCSLHHRYGGWFGFRGIIAFPTLRCPTLPRVEPLSSIPPYHPPFPKDMLNYLLTEFRDNWRSNKWRELGLPTDHRTLYSKVAITFFITPPTERAALIESWFKQLV